MISVDPHGPPDLWQASEASDFDGWDILMTEMFKPGVLRVHCRRDLPGHREFRIILAPPEIVSRLYPGGSRA
jgi:hypothetical protein